MHWSVDLPVIWTIPYIYFVATVYVLSRNKYVAVFVIDEVCVDKAVIECFVGVLSVAKA